MPRFVFFAFLYFPPIQANENGSPFPPKTDSNPAASPHQGSSLFTPGDEKGDGFVFVIRFIRLIFTFGLWYCICPYPCFVFNFVPLVLSLFCFFAFYLRFSFRSPHLFIFLTMLSSPSSYVTATYLTYYNCSYE